MSDEVFVGRCRVFATAVLRVAALLGALYTLGRVVDHVSALVASQRGIISTAGIITTIGRLGGLGIGVAIWVAAPWLARQLFPMPPESRNQCRKCKYPLDGLTGETCPECGAMVK